METINLISTFQSGAKGEREGVLPPAIQTTQRKRGRPKKVIEPNLENEETAPKKVGRPKKIFTEEEAKQYKTNSLKKYYEERGYFITKIKYYMKRYAYLNITQETYLNKSVEELKNILLDIEAKKNKEKEQKQNQIDQQLKQKKNELKLQNQTKKIQEQIQEQIQAKKEKNLQKQIKKAQEIATKKNEKALQKLKEKENKLLQSLNDKIERKNKIKPKQPKQQTKIKIRA
jgi:hypothetical protein